MCSASLIFSFCFLLNASEKQPLLEVRLKTSLTSYTSKPGKPFECVVIRDYVENGRIVIAEGSIVRGRVRKVSAVGLGLRHERATLDLDFDSYETLTGRRVPLNARLISIDNAREKVDRTTGRIRGVLAANNPENLLNGFWATPANNFAVRSLIGLTGAVDQVWEKFSLGPYAAAGMFAVHCLFVRFPEPEIQLPSGADMKLSISTPDASLVEAADVEKLDAHTHADLPSGLDEFIGKRLYPISYMNGRQAPDLINVVLLGSRSQVISDFIASGWMEADQRTIGTSSRTYLAFSSMTSYSSAPVSPMLYRNRRPDLVFEKSLDTVTQRHHIRFWSVGEYQGEPVWLGAATHDSGIKFRASRLTFTHKIDPYIDSERDKVQTDLHFSGCVQDTNTIPRLREISSGAKQRVMTDNNLVVMTTQSCAIPLADDEAEIPAPGNRLSRFVRRIVLETRNYVIRDNPYYWGYHLYRCSRNGTNPLSN